MKQHKIVLFGAGKIGRSFIGQLFSKGGYEVVFVDIFRPVIDELNRRKTYRVCIKSVNEEYLNITNVRGVYADDGDSVAHEVATANIVAVSVGMSGLAGIFTALAKGLLERYRIDPWLALDIIIAENMRNADEYFQDQLRKLLPSDYPFERLVGLVETSIGKMVPIMLEKDMEEDILQVFAEPYNTLILDKKGFKNPIPDISGLAPKENMKAWVDRKLFIHNLGHATAAYLGYLHNPGLLYMYEVLAVPEVLRSTRETMLESADILLKKYPGEFSYCDLQEHIEDLLMRFQNRALGDTVFRVGCDLKRKLGPDDRLAGAIRGAMEYDLPYQKILYALVCAFHFRATDETGKLLPEDAEFVNLYKKGFKSILESICRFDPVIDQMIFRQVREIENGLRDASMLLGKSSRP
ncbi:MAG: hypothetical protein WC699_17755 [Bacteroidales bacterium]|jgi:mannitol-1-phosphate 5-dehydrogenase